MDKELHILVLEDSPGDAELAERELRKSNLVFSSKRVETREDFLQQLADFAPDIILADYKLPQFDGVSALKLAQDVAPLTPVIIVTGSLNEEIAVDCMKAGAADYVLKGSLVRLGSAVQGALEKKQIQEEKIWAEEALKKSHDELEMRVQERTVELSKANAELARTSHLKDEFLANMSHELRTPLNSILGLSEILQEHLYGELNQQQLKALSTIEESGRLLLELINDILDLSKISAGMLELERVSFSVEAVCQTSLRFIKQIALKKHINVQFSLDSDLKTIRADERRLKQILVNLLSNAVKFTPEGGKVGLEVEGDAENHTMNFTVWDAGIGIAEENAEKLFQPFVQLDTQQLGTGLGLALVYRMVDMHGGSVALDSTPGEGSRFTVSLPWEEIPTPRPPSKEELTPSTFTKPPTPTPKHQSAMILIAEDNPANIQTFAGYLALKGYRIIIAQNGKEAVKGAKKGHPDLILMDIQMSVMGGLEAIRHIRADEDIKFIPIIALTALTMPGDREKCLAAGADEYISKPVSLHELSETIEDLLR